MMDAVTADQRSASLAWLAGLDNGSSSGPEGSSSCLTPGVLLEITDVGNSSGAIAAHTTELLDGGASHAVVAICGLCTAILLASFVFHLYWLCRAERKEDTFRRAGRLDKLVNELVMHFAPLVAVDGYKFKGMRGSACGARLDFEDLGLTLKSDGRTVLEGVTGSIGKGKMAAIMGPSGCGKTTFMNTLCGKSTYGNVSGEVRVNGVPGGFSRLRRIMGFVPQDDVVHENLTVREQIEFSAKLRNEHTLTRAEIVDIVEDVLHVLQIGHIQRSIVGGVEKRGISGGQRKRVNIGLELAACPVLLFLDEPTSGLDSTSSLMIVNALKKMTDIGMTIVMVIHQPRYSLYTLFDQVLLLGVGGRTVYLGGPEDAISYFDGLGFRREPMDNPADWLMDVISGEVASARFEDFSRERLVDLWASEAGGRKSLEQVPSQERKARRDEKVAARSVHMLRAMVAQEWAEFDPHGSLSLTRREMKRFLASCVQQEVDQEVWEQLLAKICPPSSRRRSGRRRAGLGPLVWKDEFDHFMRTKFEEMVAGPVVRPPSVVKRGGSSVARLGSSKEPGALEVRVPPGPWRQFVIISHRRLVQFWRDSVKRVLNILLFCICAGCFALLRRGASGDVVEISTCHMGLAMVLGVSVLPTFADRPMLWREASTGISILSLFLARLCVSMIDASCHTILYALVYWLAVDADCTFHIYLFPLLGLGWAVSAWGYFFSVTVPPRSATLVTLVVTLVLCQVVGKVTMVIDSLQTPAIHLLAISPTRWSVPMQFVLGVEAKGGPAAGLPIPLPPNCSGMVVDTRCDDEVDAETVDCLLHHHSADAGDCATASSRGAEVNRSGCLEEESRAADAERSRRLQVWLAHKQVAEYGRTAYRLLVRNASWVEDGVALLATGVALHAVSLLCLLQQAPAATATKEKLARGLDRCCCCCRRRPGGDEAEDSDSSSGSEGGSIRPLLRVNDASRASRDSEGSSGSDEDSGRC